MGKKEKLIGIGFLFIGYPFYVYAYMDPSVMSYTVQAVAGTLIGLGAAAGIFWRIVKKKTHSILKLDDLSRKEIEPDVVEFQEHLSDKDGTSDAENH